METTILSLNYIIPTFLFSWQMICIYLILSYMIIITLPRGTKD